MLIEIIARPMTWGKFKKEFDLEYFSTEAKDELIERFDKLQQGTRTVDDYAFEFNQLSNIAISRVPTERERVQ